MKTNLNVTRRTAVLGVATLVAVGGAVAIGLSGNSAAPTANAGTALAAGETGPLAPDAFPGITVQGVGKVTGTPDTLILTLSVTKTGGDVSTAMNGMAATMAAVQNSLKGNHVAEADMKTSGLGVGPEYNYSGNKRTVVDYQATENLTVTLRDTKTAGATISAAASAGGDATQISGLSTDLQNNSGPLNQARDAAFNDAKAKATQYAKSVGRSVGQVVRVEENVSSQPSPVNSQMKASAAGSIASVPLQMGSTDVSVQVTVVFAFS